MVPEATHMHVYGWWWVRTKFADALVPARVIPTCMCQVFSKLPPGANYLTARSTLDPQWSILTTGLA
jgi:hypothetical protein